MIDEGESKERKDFPTSGSTRQAGQPRVMQHRISDIHIPIFTTMNDKKRDGKRTIKQVLDLETGNEIIAKEFFKQPEDAVFKTRRLLEEAIQNDNPKYVCYYCKQKIKIAGGGSHKKKLHFSHLYDSDDCPIKTENTFTKEEIERIKYNGAKESPLHIELKEFIKNSLIKNKENDKGISHVESERIYKDKAISKEWRKPDVSSVYKGLRLVLELQLSTTFLSTIVARENFYKERKIYILWIFHQFDTDSDLQKFTQKDVIYANKQNAFVLNKEAQAKSIESNDLVLLCYYQEPYLDNQNISTRWKSKYVSLNDLKFDEKEYKVFFYDTEQEVTNLKLRVQYEREEKVKLAQERHDKIESRVKQVLLLFNEFFKTDRCPQKLNYELPRLSHEEAECLYAKILNTRYGNISKPFIHYLIEHGKHNNLLLFLFQQKYINEKIGYQFPDLCWKVFTSNLNQAEREAMEKVKSFLFAIISLKLGIIINSKLPNFNAYSNHILHSKREFSKLFIKSLRRYDRYKTILANDKSGAFRKKIAEIENSSLPQNESYDHIFIKIFPELFDQTQ